MLDEYEYHYVYVCCASEYRDLDGMAVVGDNVAVYYARICNTILTLVIVAYRGVSVY